ncbi:hypothetical protein C8J57DRAFT_1235090 [Mycena rebaudengoi]|nr:hypothetical protein C8J57DRAFT_1235090 [Mycena rebaudengoi]
MAEFVKAERILYIFSLKAARRNAAKCTAAPRHLLAPTRPSKLPNPSENRGRTWITFIITLKPNSEKFSSILVHDLNTDCTATDILSLHTAFHFLLIKCAIFTKCPYTRSHIDQIQNQIFNLPDERRDAAKCTAPLRHRFPMQLVKQAKSREKSEIASNQRTARRGEVQSGAASQHPPLSWQWSAPSFIMRLKHSTGAIFCSKREVTTLKPAKKKKILLTSNAKRTATWSTTQEIEDDDSHSHESGKKGYEMNSEDERMLDPEADEDEDEE